MADLGNLDELIERVSAATGADREIDALIEVQARRFQAYAVGLTDDTRAKWQADASGLVHDPDTRYFAQRYTSSIDAAIGLVERMLPGAYGNVLFGAVPIKAHLIWDHRKRTALGNTIVTTDSCSADAATPPLAILIALLRALRARSVLADMRGEP